VTRLWADENPVVVNHPYVPIKAKTHVISTPKEACWEYTVDRLLGSTKGSVTGSSMIKFARQ